MAIRVNLITGRTIQQGVSMEAGKEKPAYTAACGIIELDLDTDLVARELERMGELRRSGPHAENILRDLGAVAHKAV